MRLLKPGLRFCLSELEEPEGLELLENDLTEAAGVDIGELVSGRRLRLLLELELLAGELVENNLPNNLLTETFSLLRGD